MCLNRKIWVQLYFKLAYFRLWTDPYYDKASGPVEDKMLQLACNLAISLELKDLDVLQALK